MDQFIADSIPLCNGLVLIKQIYLYHFILASITNPKITVTSEDHLSDEKFSLQLTFGRTK